LLDLLSLGACGRFCRLWATSGAPPMTAFPIYDVTGATTDRPEMLGTKEKFWLIPSKDMGLPIVNFLFKVGRPGTGENWAEKVCCEILRSVDVACASYEFAVHESDAGVISKSLLSYNQSFAPANMLLEGTVKDYDGRIRFRQKKYLVSSSLNLFDLRSIGPPGGMGPAHSKLKSSEVFVGYLVFDALVGNTDRHHENWGVIVDYTDRYTPAYNLAATFDHASSLGRNETDAARSRRLTSRDRRDTVEAYASRARSAFYGSAADERTLVHKQVLDELIRLKPEATRYWARIFSGIPSNVYRDIFARIDPKLISDEAAQFAQRMLQANASLIKQYA
jgi:hypothetical protein